MIRAQGQHRRSRISIRRGGPPGFRAYGEEEWLLVLEGSPSVRHPGGTDQLEPWDAVCFPPGPDGAHAVWNETGETVRVLMFSSVKHPAATVYPDSDKLGIWTGNQADDLITTRSSAVDYWFGESGSPSGSPEAPS